jgi:peptide methionine sulfoxide reductase msrA/msrB
MSAQLPQYNKLTSEEQRVILNKGTEYPNTGIYLKNKEKGTYICKQCNAPLYKSEDKFDSHCGWPSFDDEIPGAVKRVTDADGRRTEIVCANCEGHLGHVFLGERFTTKNTRHCVNSISMRFIKSGETLPQVIGKRAGEEVAYFASGCFWGTEFYLQRADGVISTTVGYMGGRTKNPTYQEVCTGTTGHAEAVKVVFDPSKTTYETLARLFFETHDPTQINRQGPDVGTQYRSAIFYANESQKEVAQNLIRLLQLKGLKIATQVNKADEFYSGENYHQKYYDKNGKRPYCHAYRKLF